MTRRLVNLVTVLSLLACIAAATMWASGYVGSPCPVWRRSAPVQGLHFSVGSTGQELTLGIVTPTVLGRASMARASGFGYVAGGASGQLPDGTLVAIGTYQGVQAPLWAVATAAAGLPLLRTSNWLLKRRRVRPGLCSRCGYDLRATPEKCPECGQQAGDVSGTVRP